MKHKKVLLSEYPEMIEKLTGYLDTFLDTVHDGLKENMHYDSVDAELVLDPNKNLIDVRLFDAYQQIKTGFVGADYRNPDGWSNWLLESGFDEEK